VSTRETLIEFVKILRSPRFLVDGTLPDDLTQISPRILQWPYMISVNPASVFEQITDDVAELKRVSDKMTSQFNAISEVLLVIMEEGPDFGMHVFKEVSKDFCKNFHGYQTKF
jgi:hypothetical protein